jgi:GH25 family lysozyme M1 (1,4-beta-N-acetylmuramidase)
MLIQAKSFINSLTPSPLGNTRALGIDISHYQEAVDWSLVMPWIDFAIIKCMDAYRPDHHFAEHYDNAMAAKVPIIGAYMWYDPLLNPKRQAEATIAALDGRKPAFITIDDEQYWDNWQGWLTRKSGGEYGIFGDNQITPGTKVLYNELKNLTNIPLMIYTSPGFVNSYTKTLVPWLADKFLHFAQYPWNIQNFNRKNANTWETLIQNVLPILGSNPVTPRGIDSKNWLMWQFSGDYYTLPGIYGFEDKHRLSAVDLNVFNGTLADMKKLFGIETTTPPPVLQLSLDEKVNRLWEAHPELNK